MKIKGKLLISLVIRDLEVGQSGWVSPSHFLYTVKENSVYKIYFNMEAPFVSEKEGEFVLKVVRESDKEDGFIVDLGQVAVSFQTNIVPPTNLKAYLGPFELNEGVEIYSLVASYSRLTVGELNSYLEEAQTSVQNEDGVYSSPELDAILDALLIKSEQEWDEKSPIDLAEQVLEIRKLASSLDDNGIDTGLSNDEQVVKVPAWKNMKKSFIKRSKSLKKAIRSKLEVAPQEVVSEYYFKFEEEEDLLKLLPTK